MIRNGNTNDKDNDIDMRAKMEAVFGRELDMRCGSSRSCSAFWFFVGMIGVERRRQRLTRVNSRV